MSVRLWSSVSVAIQSALATVVSITSISLASPGVVTHAGTSPVNGSFVVLKTSGMPQVNNRVFRVANKTTTTFELEGENTTNYGEFASGTFEIITFGTSLGTVRGVSASGGEYNFVDTTTIHDDISTQSPGVASAVVFNLENRWQPEDAGLAALRSASDAKSQRAVKFGFADGAICAFFGYIGATGVPGGSAQDLVTTPVTITASGLPTNYAV